MNVILLTAVMVLFLTAKDQMRSVDYMLTGLFVLLLLINLYFYLRRFFKKAMFYFYLKSTTLLIMSAIGGLMNGVIKGLICMFLFLVIVEIYIFAVNHSKPYIRNLMVLSAVGLLIIGMTSVLSGTDFVMVIMFVLIVALFIYALYLVLTDYREDMMSKVKLQSKLFREAAKTNDELRLSQNKFKKIHEEVAQQKTELESANKKLNKMTAEIFTQNELLRYISSVLDIKELMSVVSDAIVGTIGVDTCSVVVFDERNENYLFSVNSNHPGDYQTRLKEDVLKGCLQSYFEDDKIHLNNRVVSSRYPFVADRPVGSVVIIPLLRDSLTYGLIIAEHSNIDMFTESNLQFFTGIATQITIAVNNANIYALMEDMAIKDGLTGIYNRKYLQDNIDRYIAEARANDSSLAAALFDIDKFKSVNDKYGHLFGDEAIKVAASTTMMIAASNQGLAFRYGGEEFILLLPGKTVESALPIVEAMHQKIKEVTLVYEGEEVHINVSIGLTSYPELAVDGEQLLSRADNAMYYSKQNGRGRITVDKENIEKVV